MDRKKIILDCDPGMDDSMAIVMACKSELLNVLAVTTVNGNYPADITVRNAGRVLAMLGRSDVRYAKGMETPLVREAPRDPFTHGADGQAGANLADALFAPDALAAADLIACLVNENPGEITLIATGPLTNLALAMRKAPEIKEKIKEIIAISGAFGLNEAAFLNATGDTPQSEWNVYVDPEAADLVYRSGVPFTAIGLDVAAHFDITLSGEEIEKLENSDRREAAFLRNAIRFVNSRGFDAYCAVIDCMAVACAIDPGLIKTMRAHVGVETKDGLTLGMTVTDRRHHHVWESLPVITVGCGADYRGFLDLLMRLVLR